MVAGVVLMVGVPSRAAVSRTANQLYAFGLGDYGELGSPARNAPYPPRLVRLPGASGAVTRVAAGFAFSLVATATGQLYAFGVNAWGQLGNATNNGAAHEYTPNSPRLVRLPGASGAVTKIAAGFDFSLVVTSTGQLYAFGDNDHGQLGSATNTGRPTSSSSPSSYFPTSNPTPRLVRLPGAAGRVTRVAAGGDFSLVVTSTGQLYAFGGNRFGQLGSATNNGTNNANPTPMLVRLPGASGPVTQVAASDTEGTSGFSLAVTSTGQLYAFGDNRYGQLGSATNNGADTPNPTPRLVRLPGASGRVTRVAAGFDFSLVVTSTGQLYAFGDNFAGQLGNATNNNRLHTANPTPRLVRLPGASGAVTRVAAGDLTSLVVTSTGQLYAFGLGIAGALGNALPFPSGCPRCRPANPTPMLVSLPGASGPVTQIAEGSAFSLAVTSTG